MQRPARPDKTDLSPGATISLQDAARLMGVSLKAARRAVKNGDIPAISWGRSYRVLRMPFEALLRTGVASSIEGRPSGQP
jgi:excisionase family DNA binding protein